MLGATLVGVLTRYAKKLREVNGRLYLTGLSEEVHAELEQMRRLRLTGPMRTFEATTIRGQSTQAAYADAEAWLVAQGDDAGVVDAVAADSLVGGGDAGGGGFRAGGVGRPRPFRLVLPPNS